jgi:hypothetical protein
MKIISYIDIKVAAAYQMPPLPLSREQGLKTNV